MATTPPPPPARERRIHTPPTPRHGAKHDNYEPYSPRRSTRVAGQRKNYSLSQAPTTSPSSRKELSRDTRAVTPPTFGGSQTFSPPESPNSPPQIMSSARKRKPALNGTKGKQAHFAHAITGSDSEFDVHSSTMIDPFRADTRGAFPTPAKTPRKKQLQPQTSLAATARVLFQDRPGTVEDLMPTPKKGRRSKKNAFTLSSFEDADEEDDATKIPIYTDSKERLPSVGDAAEDNPFLTRGGWNSRSTTRVTRTRRKTAEEVTMEEAVKADEGLVFLFRGKKVLRKFDDVSSGDDHDLLTNDTDVLRQSGASRRITRSSIKPRLLFPNESQRRARAAAENAADEEALTDIDPMQASYTPRPTEAVEAAQVTTPVKARFQAATPPPSRPESHRRVLKHSPVPIDTTPPSVEDDSSPVELPVTGVRQKKTGPFSSWSRTKEIGSGSQGTKREGESLQNGESSKRTRSGAHL